MNSEKIEYGQLYETILKEHRKVFEKQNMEQTTAVMEAIKGAKRVFLMGVGREGLATKSFAMRLMHLGKETHWIWDDTTPNMAQGDLFIATNGSGQIGHINYVLKQAKKTGAKVTTITGSPNEKLENLSDLTLFVPAYVYNGTDDRVVPSVQPMGNLFEQHLLLFFDIIVLMLSDELDVSYEEMARRHRNVE